MLYIGLLGFISYGLANWISSVGLEYWRSAVGVIAGAVLGFILSTAGLWLFAIFFLSTDSSFDLKAIGRGFLWSIIFASMGAYHARYKLKTGDKPPPFKIPNWASYSMIFVVLAGIGAMKRAKRWPM